MIKIVIVYVTSKIIFLLSLTYSRTSRSYAWGCLIRLKRIYNFWCSMLVYTPFDLCFVTLRGIFMRFWTNLLTRCHSASASSLFSAIFVFQKSYTGNILGIGRNKSQTSDFYRSFTKTEDETEGGSKPGSPPGGTAQALAAPPYGEASWPHLWWCPFAYKFPSTGKT
jgi:hypothetical protein